MFGTLFKPESRLLRRIAAVTLGGAVLAAGGLWFLRGTFADRARAQSPTASIPSAFTPNPTDYSSRVVAYLHTNQPVTRQELGEYLIARFGPAKLPTLINKRILDRECWSRGIVITAGEVEAALQNEMRNVPDKNAFLKAVLTKHKKNLHEFKEDILRPRVQMTRLCVNRVEVTADDLRKAFESVHGEKVEGRLVIWPGSQRPWVLENYSKLRDNETFFDDAARKQPTSELAASAGKIRPITRYSMDERIERAAFKLRPGEVSEVIETPQGVAVFRCDRRLPADTTVNFDAVKAKLEAEIREKKLQVEMAETFQSLRKQVKVDVDPSMKPTDRLPTGPLPSPTATVAYLGSEKITREELGEFLIARFGPEKLELMVNRKIIDAACAEKNIVVTDHEVDTTLDAELKQMKMDRKVFEKEMLSRWGKTMLEWREDVVRPKLMLGRLTAGRVTVSADDLKKGFEAYYGERMRCRMILYPRDQANFARAQYTTLRDSDLEFDRAARQQATPTLASEAGFLPVFGRNSLGDENLEREAFRLQPGEVSPVIETPQGHVILKCIERVPPDAKVKLEDVKARLTDEIMRKKTDTEMQVVFGELRAKASPKLLLRASGMPEDLLTESKKLLGEQK